MKNLELTDIEGKRIVWTITNFTSLKTNDKHFSDVFNVSDCAWKLKIYRGRADNRSLSIYMEAVNAKSFPSGWSILVDYCITVINQKSRHRSLTKGVTGSPVRFDGSYFGQGYYKFMPLNVLEDPNDGYVLNDKCVVEVDIFSVTSEGLEPTSLSKDPSLLNQPNDIHLEDAVVNFKDLGQIDKALVPMLEEACSWHPSLLNCNTKRSRKFSEWAFTCLGQVLHFLKKRKWKDMNQEACEELQALWDELEMSRMDLSWLESHVKSALNMKGYLEKEMKVKRLRQDLAVSEAEMKKMKENLANTEKAVEVKGKELVKAQVGFEELDLDLNAEIGYGKP